MKRQAIFFIFNLLPAYVQNKLVNKEYFVEAINQIKSLVVKNIKFMLLVMTSIM